MTTDAIAGEAVVAALDRLQNPRMRMLDGHDVGPRRQRLPGAGPVPAKQLDDDPEEKFQYCVAGQLRQSQMEPKLLDGGLAHIAGALSGFSVRCQEGRQLGLGAPLDRFGDVVDLDGVPDTAQVFATRLAVLEV